MALFNIASTKSRPKPWIAWPPTFPLLSIGEAAGYTATTSVLESRSFKTSPMPVMVPPVPTPATKPSTFPSMSRIISCAGVSLYVLGLAGLLNWSRDI